MISLHYHRIPIVLEGYSRTDWNTLSDDYKAISGYIFSVASGVVSCKLKKHTILTLFMMKYEMIALATASEECG